MSSTKKIGRYVVTCFTSDDEKRVEALNVLFELLKDDLISGQRHSRAYEEIVKYTVLLLVERTRLLEKNEKLSKDMIAMIQHEGDSDGEHGYSNKVDSSFAAPDEHNSVRDGNVERSETVLSVKNDGLSLSVAKEEHLHDSISGEMDHKSSTHQIQSQAAGLFNSQSMKQHLPANQRQTLNASERKSGASYNDDHLPSQQDDIRPKPNVSHQQSGQREPSQVERAIIEAWIKEWHEPISVPKLRERIGALPSVTSAELQNSSKMLIVRTTTNSYLLPLRLDYEYCENAYSAETPPGSSSTVQKLITLARVDSSGTVIQRGHLVITG